jgi:prepilin-type processing-associated H-X9-DG protein
MRYKTKTAKRDILVALGCLVFLLLNLGAFDERGRAHAKKMVCLTNVRQLAHAWLLYAYDNDDKLVNGATGYSNSNFSWGEHTDELAWVDSYSSNSEGTVRGIRDGALWPYLEDLNIYRCPVALRGEMLTYSIMFSMNAVCHTEVHGVRGAHVKKLTEIQNPEQRLVFIDEGRMTPDAFAVYYSREQWWDGPGIRHSDGTTVSFADGHSEHWKWKGIDTVRNGWEKERNWLGQWRPETELGFQELYRMQKGCWGQLGYLPSYLPRQ